MIIGRAISGLGVGLGVPATAIYVAEVLILERNILFNGMNQGFQSRVKRKVEFCSCSSIGSWCSTWICFW